MIIADRHIDRRCIMLRGLYIAGSGMTERAANMEVVANNIANMQSNTFKRDRVVLSSFREMMLTHIQAGQKSHEIGNLAMGASAATDTYTDFTQGPLTQTGNPNDVAIDGKGFVKLALPDGSIRYTRDASWEINPDGTFVDKTGNPILDDSESPIIISTTGPIDIKDTGEIIQGGQTVGTIGLVELTDTNLLEKDGNATYKLRNGIDSGSVEQKPTDTILRQRHLERANFSPVEAVIEMIQVLREYESSSKVLQVIDDTVDQAVTKLGAIK
jgi:flagellar basal body rod protein FlgG